MKNLLLLLCELIIFSTAVSAQPINGYLYLTSATINGFNLNPANPIVIVQTGDSITGRVNLLANNLGVPTAVAPLAATPSWGEHSSSFWGINSWIPTGLSHYTTDINLSATTENGLYYVYFAFQLEMTFEQVMSLTNWSLGYPVWHDTINVADWYDMHAQMAIDSGYVRTLYLLDGGYHYWNVPAAAIRVQVENPPVIITLTPHDPPIQIPAGGGRFQFDIDIINNDTIAYTIDAWTSITTPSGGEFTILAINNMNLPVGGTISRDNIMQFVPGTALPGLYFYNAYVQDHNTWELLAQASFHFTKLPGNDALTHNMGWACLGWEEINESYYSPSPLAFSLAPAYPNPFNPSTIITFDLPEAGEISLIIYDISGREIQSLVTGHLSLGTHQVEWNAEGMPSGIYFARLTAGEFTQTQKIVLMK